MKIILTAIALLTLACGAPNPPVSNLVESSSGRLSQPVNWAKVNDTLYRSGEVKEAHMEGIKSRGISHILSLEHLAGEISQGDHEDEWAANADITLFRVPLDPHDKPTVEQIEKALAIMLNPHNQPILVHCFHGEDRTGIAIAAYRIRHDHWSVDGAIREMRNLGHRSNLFFWDDVLNQIARQVRISIK